MPYVPVPKDLTHVRQKVLFNLTRRQLVCFLGGALVGTPLFYLLKPYVASSVASLVMVLVMIPFILLGVYEKNGEPLEVVLKHFFTATFLRPKKTSVSERKSVRHTGTTERAPKGRCPN